MSAPWQPLITDPAERARVTAAIADVVAAVTPGETTDELADVALLRAYVADVVPDDADVSGEMLSRAVTLFTTAGVHLGLYGGAARIGFTIAHLTDGETADQVCASIDRIVLASLADGWSGPYDLISGLVGLGVYAVERGDAGRAIAVRVLELLEQRARPHGGGLAWFTAPEELPEWQRTHAPLGYWNLGLAHGIPGIVGIVARFHAAGIEPERCARLIDGAVGYLLSAQPPATPRFSAWLVEGSHDQRAKSRLAWCYGDLGIAVALYRAARVRGRADWDAEAREIALGRAAEPLDSVGVVDTGVCHGAAGNAHLYHRLYRATGDERFAAAARTWLGHTFALRNDRPFAGFPAWFQLPGADGAWDEGDWKADACLLTGAPGVALVLAAMVTELEPSWDRLLLADV